ncbi:MAG: hypothetical protein EOO42_03440 [Flavobacteriales bacterium]|nr:MAG: hypothetical protein EOO42_03440 [Flavobacteriales bacterium]
MKYTYIKYLVLITIASFFTSNVIAQCNGCTLTGPTSGNHNFANGNTICFTSNAILGDVTFGNNVKLCVAPGVTVVIQNNVSTTMGNNLAFEVAGVLQFNQPPDIKANLAVNIQNEGILKSGPSGTNNFNFGGTSNSLNNNGKVVVGVLGFENSTSINIVDNYGTLTIAANINVKGTTTFRNWNLIDVGSNFNNNSNSKYINCGTFNSVNGFNLGGGTVINVGVFNVTSGQIDLSGGRLDNYGTLYCAGGINGTNNSTLYNEGLVKLSNFQPNGATIKGPNSDSKLGYFYLINPINPNGAKVGPNLDFKKYTSFNPDVASAMQGQTQIFSATPTFVNASGNTVADATLAKISFACTTCGAPLVTNIGICPNINGSFPTCTNSPATGTPDTYTQTGYSNLNGFSSGAAGWPGNIPNGFIAIESKKSGFVITRIKKASDIAAPVAGMLIYDIEAACIKLYNGTVWKCLAKDCT